ncbi:cytochrome P450 [Saccharothrix texasensis]|uniref:Cytochrome P450 n=1 Tax=Saccharothrix texasensis TaxID=103734 RepID=A0A3N1HEX2_9PSEU|nr:cytochrome P450 [Saccharothrix texasensis]ROP41061.1 cytochrome P450 [Saccharothrix texasensis]
MASAHTDPIAYPFHTGDGLGLDPAYARARDADGLIRVRMPFGEESWLATRYDDVRLVLGDPRFSRARAVEHDEPRLSPGRLTGGILALDPPDHTRLRTLVAKAFTTRRVERLRPRVADLATALIRGLELVGPPVDLVEHYALSIPVAVICELLGVPVADRPRFRRWSDGLLSTSGLDTADFDRDRGELRGYFADLVARRRAHPADDLVSALVEARDAHDRLTEAELVDLSLGLLVAGHETTASQIANFAYVLLLEPDRWRRLVADPGLVPGAVEELLRYVPVGASAAFSRYATEDVEVGGTLVRAGEPVLCALNAANRDRLRFDGPEELRLDRAADRHLAFGHGAHHCLGAPLARLELREALHALLRDLPGLHLAGEVVWKTRTLVRGPRSMPVAW